MEFPINYNNGNCVVTIESDGTKIRETSDEKFDPIFPESIDMKITDYCDLECDWCHEKSSKKGFHADIEIIKKNLSGLPKGVEIAIGGGNPLAHPDFKDLVVWLKTNGLIANVTINAKHLPRYKDVLERYIDSGFIYGIGVSYDGVNFFDTPNTVYHVIAGIHGFSEIRNLISSNRDVLILGYKKYGRGIGFFDFDVKNKIKELKNNIWRILNKGNISFDNLAIEQLNIDKFIIKEDWDEFYMGDDGTFTMYYDAVKNEYALSSISERVKVDVPVIDWFAVNRRINHEGYKKISF